MEKKEKAKIDKIANKLKTKDVTDEKKAVKADEPLKGAVSDLEIHNVEPVIKAQDKGKKPKRGAKNEPKKQDRKTNGRTIEKSEEKPEARKESPLAIPDRKRSILERIFPPWW